MFPSNANNLVDAITCAEGSMTTADETDLEIAWREGLSAGDAQIDREHKQLIGRVNDVIAGLAAEIGQEEILRLMQRLLDTAIAHFTSEERLLRDRGYPDSEQHHVIHERLAAEFYAAMDNFADTPTNLASLAKGLHMSRVLMEHLAREDMKYRDWFHSKGG